MREHPTILVVNEGAHIYPMETFQNDIDDFFTKNIETSRRSDDMVIYRSTAPGHEHCENYSEPFTSQEEFKEPTMYNWNMMTKYNDYVKSKLSSLSLMQNENEENRVKLMYLDIYNMTILRPDGHSSHGRDCLHYVIPGVPDYWNHLLYSNLLDYFGVREENDENDVDCDTEQLS